MDVIAVLGQSMTLPDVTIEPRIETPYGPGWGTPVTATAYVEAKRQYVRDLDGAEVLSETTVYAPPGTVCAAGSRVTLPDGTQTTVIKVSAYVGEPLPEHVEITCR